MAGRVQYKWLLGDSERVGFKDADNESVPLLMTWLTAQIQHRISKERPRTIELYITEQVPQSYQ